jgi:hypothetical protein
MGLSDWIGTFGKAQTLNLSSDLERGYEAALQIQSIELEHYNDRPVRPELELRIPRSIQAQLLRRFRAASQVCQQTLQEVQPYRQELTGQETRQLHAREFEADMRERKVLFDDKKGRLTTGWKSAISTDPAYLYWFRTEIPSELLNGS